MTVKPLIIALEEHYADSEIQATFTGMDAQKIPKLNERLDDTGALRTREMDEAGIDIQMLSHTPPSVQKLEPELAVRLARAANDRLHQTVLSHAGRFAAFAALPTPDPNGAADELERTVTEFGFKCAMIHRLTRGRFLDDEMFWPVFQRAAALDVPLYLHPAIPHPAVLDVYFGEYAKTWPMFPRAAWGFTMETATQAIRLVLSGVLEKYGTKIILGHLGEGLPFLLWRIDHALKRAGTKSFRDSFCEHFLRHDQWLFLQSAPALQRDGIGQSTGSCSRSIYPYVENTLGTGWIEKLPLCREDREKLLSGNAKKLLKL